MNAWILCGVGLFALSGCSLLGQSSQYHPREPSDPQGYSETQLADNQYQVVYEAYQDNDWRRVADLALYRAAEIGKERGYAYFLIENSQRHESIETITVPAVYGTTQVGHEEQFAGTVRSMVTPEYMIDYRMRQVAVTVSYLGENTAQNLLGVDAVLSRIQNDYDL